MCLAVPAKVVAINAALAMAKVDLDGIQKEVSLALVDDVVVGDYVLVHVGYALERIDAIEAEKTLELFAELRALDVNPDYS